MDENFKNIEEIANDIFDNGIGNNDYQAQFLKESDITSTPKKLENLST